MRIYLNTAASETYVPFSSFPKLPKGKIRKQNTDQGTKCVSFLSLQRLCLLHFLHLPSPGTYPSNPEMPKKLNPTLLKHTWILLTLQKVLPPSASPTTLPQQLWHERTRATGEVTYLSQIRHSSSGK